MSISSGIPQPMIYKALFKAQQKMTAAKKGSANPFFKSKYANLEAILEACEPALNEEGIMILQPCTTLGVETHLVHVETGERLTGFVPFVGTTDMQKLGGAITYARRYGLQSLLCLVTEDDDGNDATGKEITAQMVVELIQKMDPGNQPVAMKLLAKAATDPKELKQLYEKVEHSLKGKK